MQNDEVGQEIDAPGSAGSTLDGADQEAQAGEALKSAISPVNTIPRTARVMTPHRRFSESRAHAGVP
jgi:hypothetical protein